jgi:hypothetical protein
MGSRKTSRIWDSLRRVLGRAIALALPGFGTPRPAGFTATKDAYAECLANALSEIEEPIDLVGHDLGALRVATAFDVPLRSFAVDVAPIFHPEFEWPERVHRLQTPGVGEDLLKAMREADPEDRDSTATRLANAGVPIDEAKVMGSVHDETMSRCILDFYRSAVPNVGADWWKDVKGRHPFTGAGPPSARSARRGRRSLEVAQWLGAETARLDYLGHCWMAEAPR